MTPLQYRVLGPVDVRDGEHPVHLPAGHQRAVLACLLIARGRPVSADVLIDAAWPSTLPADPRGALHTVLSRLRSTLGEESVATVPGGYVLRTGPGEVDVDRFEQLRDRARTAPPAEAAELLRTAEGLWRGPAYSDHADERFATAEAARLDRLRLDTVEDRAAALIACAEHGAAVEELDAMLREDPFRERAVHLLMTALYGAGRAADALECFRTHRDRLADELGLDPAPSLVELQARILGHEMPVPESATAVPAPVTGADTSTSFLGRELELAELSRFMARSRLVTVTGVGGVGKTRLVAEALPHLARRHGPVVVVVELATADPGQVAARVARALGAGGGASTLIEDIVEFLSISHLLLVLDNCEHLLAETAALADAMIRHCPQVRILATSRHRLGVTAEQVLPLSPFAEPDQEQVQDPAVQLFLDRLAQVRPDVRTGTTEAVRRLCRRLDGLPLAIELAAARAATVGVDAVDALLESGANTVLPGLDAVVDWSVRLLTPAQRRLLALLSVIAGPFDQEVVVALAGRMAPTADVPGVPGVAEDLAELVEAHLLVRPSTDAGVPAYGMLAIVRSRARVLLEESVTETTAQSAHAEWVADLLRRGAREWTAGGTVAASRRLRAQVPDVAAALRWALEVGRLGEAADLAVALTLHLHWVTDVTLSDLVIEVGERCAQRPDVQRAPGEAAAAMACAVRGLFEPAQRLARCALHGEPTVEGRLLAGAAMAVSSMHAGRLDDSARWARTVVDDPEVPAGHRADLRVTLALAACYSGDLVTARAATDLAMLGAQAAGAEAAYAFALYADGELTTPTEPGRGAARFRDAAQRADRVDAQHIGQVARLALFAVLVRERQHDEALRLALPLLQDVRRVGAWPQVWTFVRLLAELLMVRGCAADAALLFGAADVAEGAPPLIAADVERGVAGRLRTVLGDEVLQGIAQVAAGLSRTQVMDRAVALLTEQRQRGS